MIILASHLAIASWSAACGQCRRHYVTPTQAVSTTKIDDRLTVDFDRREVLVNGERISLRPTEYRLLYHLVQNAGFVMPHETLLAKVWGQNIATKAIICACM